MNILIPILTLGFLGLIFGVGLALAAKRFTVVSDERLEKIHGLLPGSNCGVCGGAGCFGFAEGLLSGKMSIDACRVSAPEAKEQIAQLLGKAWQEKIKTVAVLHCNAGKKVKDRFSYEGLADCVAANLFLGGQKECSWGCLGFSSCERVCPFGAIKMSAELLPVVDKDKCKACNKCVLICPKKLFSLVPIASDIYVACSSHDPAKIVAKVCPVGCIGCKKCESVCPAEAIKVIDNLAVIDYTKCTSCGKCVEVCPRKIILRR
jgi:Na+-translocating ferredoxin:NAD+ oxidoreductase RNF subunit RnfB